MTEHLESLFGSAVGMLPSAPARSLELFTEITNFDETACDAWVGRIRCGDTERVTLFRAWYSRTNFGQLAGAAEISMNSLNARIPIGGLYGDITYPINSPLAITMGFAVHEAAVGNYADAMEALEDVPSTGAEHLVSWVKAVIYGAAERWTDVIDEVRGRRLRGRTSSWRPPPGSHTASPPPTSGCSPRPNAVSPSRILPPPGRRAQPRSPGILAMTRRSQGNEECRGSVAGVAAGHPPRAESRGRAEGSGATDWSPPLRRRLLPARMHGTRRAWKPTTPVKRSYSPRRRRSWSGRSG